MTGKLSSGDLEIFARFPCLTAALFHALVCPELSRKSAEARLADLKKHGLIEAHPLTANKVYYGLTVKGRKALGMKGRLKPFGPHAVMRHITTAAHSKMTGAKFMTQEEVEDKFAEVFFGEALWPSGIPSTLCYMDTPETFCCLMVDYGKHIRRLHKSIEKLFRRLEAFSVARSLLAAGNYKLVVVTGLETKAERIRRLRVPYPITVVVVPELGELLRG
jgi:hypothetical protein